MLQGAFLALMGPRAVLGLLFPLAYMLFLVPMGDELVPLLQTITAKITIALTHWSGIPADIDGVFIDTPVGLFEVAEACSGVKFLIAMIAFGLLVGNVCFVGWKRRAAFMAVCVAVPVVANGVRAWGTIFAAQYVGVEAAAGFDHIVYGWIFFAIVIALVLALAWRFFDRPLDDPGVDAGAINASPLLDRLAGLRIGTAPALIVLAALALAITLVDLDSRLDAELWVAWPRLFGAGAAGSRGMLEAIATSMITVAGVVFSITIAALAQASSQYSSRLLRNFMSDRTNQTVLGVFVGIFIYCLVVLRTIRGGDEGAFVPSLAVLGGIGLSFVGIGFLIYFIHHIASSLQASHIIASVTGETVRAIDHLFPQPLGEEKPPADAPPGPELPAADYTQPVPAQRTGYIQAVDTAALLAFARERRVVVRMESGIGEFVVEGTALVTLATLASSAEDAAGAPLDETGVQELNRAYTVDRQRTIDQDAGFGIRQIVDVANKALSPGINDTTTAVICIDYLTAILVRLAQRHIESPYRFEGAALRVIARGATFADLLAGAFDEIRRNGEGNVTVLARLGQALATLAGVAEEPERRRALLQQAEALQEVVRRSVRAPLEREQLDRQCLQLLVALQPTKHTGRSHVF